MLTFPPLFIDLARYGSSIGTVPNGMLASFWQFAGEHLRSFSLFRSDH